FLIARRSFDKQRGRRPFWTAFRASKDPSPLAGDAGPRWRGFHRHRGAAAGSGRAAAARNQKSAFGRARRGGAAPKNHGAGVRRAVHRARRSPPLVVPRAAANPGGAARRVCARPRYRPAHPNHRAAAGCHPNGAPQGAAGFYSAHGAACGR
nr:hypothetical protein [Tanacetum cinerariifolium]